MLKIDELKPAPAGFGKCEICAYRETGTSHLCYACARKEIEPLPDPRCSVCDQRLNQAGRCSNVVCGWDISVRFFEWNYAIAMRSGRLRNAIDQFKYAKEQNATAKGWATIFGRVIVGALGQEPNTFGWFDEIIPSPTFVGGTRRTWDHTRLLVRAAWAYDEENEWPFRFDEPLIEKIRETPQLVGLSWRDRRDVAEGEIRNALRVPRPRLVEGKDLLVIDDVFTDGLNLREVARALILQGRANSVCGLTLCRQPWGN